MPLPVLAKYKEPVRRSVLQLFQPAIPHRGLKTAQAPLEMDKIRSFVVLVQGGLAAERAYWFITNQEYNFHPVVVDIAKGAIKSRRGKVATYLDRGTIMALVDVKFSGSTIYFRLLSVDVQGDTGAKRAPPSRVGLLLGLKLPANIAKSAEAAVILKNIEQWIVPYQSYAEAKTAAQTFAN